MWDTVIVGGGPAGLSAALVLSRCCRRVLVIDDARPRNARAHGVHNFLTREGTPPARLRTLARREVRRRGVTLRRGRVTAAVRRRGGGFDLTADGRRVATRTLLLATGIRDHAPAIPGIARYAGCGVYYCAYCDGYTVRDRPLVALGHGVGGAELALALTTWSDRVTYCTNGSPRPRGNVCAQLGRYGITVVPDRVVALEGATHLQRLVLAGGTRLACRGLFVQEGDRPQSDLAERLGCDLTRGGSVRTRSGGHTTVPSLYVAGDAADDVRAVVVAAASGAKAAFAINKELREARCRLRT